jgi:hypothetical protein
MAAAAGNNMITLSNFALGGGAIVTPLVSSIGGVTVSSSPLSIVLVDSSFFQDVQLTFTPGSTLTFQFDSTSNVDAVDTFTMAILDNTGTEIPTNNPNGLIGRYQWIGCGSHGNSVPSCDVGGNRTATIADVQRMICEALGMSATANDLNNDGVINAVDIQLIISAALGQGCPVS